MPQSLIIFCLTLIRHQDTIVRIAELYYACQNGNGEQVALAMRFESVFSSAGRRLSLPVARNTSYSSYNSHGQLEKTWGSAAYPVLYEFDSYGRQTKQHTYRGGTGWAGATWPESPGDADTTTWAYHEASRLLVSKTDAAGKSVSYTYSTGGRPATRTWARTDGTNSLVTTYNYSTAGDLTGLDYSDSTPNVTFTVDRLGRQKTASSSISSHEFAYSGLMLDTETIVGNGFTNVIDRSQDGFGRPTGFTLGSGYEVAYSYEGLGRFSSVSFTNGSFSSLMSYSYLQNSDLISGYSDSVSGLQVNRSFEANRNLITSVSNMIGTNIISRFAYQNDAVGRRTL